MRRTDLLVAERITDFEQYCRLADEAQTRFLKLATNSFLLPGSARLLIDKRRLYYAEGIDAVSFLIENPGVYRCMYYADMSKEPDLLLKRLGAAVAVDEICTGEQEADPRVTAMLERSGFRFLRKSIGMSKRSIPQQLPPKDEMNRNRAAYAQASELDAIYELLQKSFDPYADRLPWKDELAELIEMRHVYVIREDKRVIAAMVSIPNGKTLDNHWIAIEPAYRGDGLAPGLFSFGDRDGLERGFHQISAWIAQGNQGWLNKITRYCYTVSGRVLNTYLLEA